MVSTPRKRLKHSQSDSNHTIHLKPTSKENPLLIQGYNVFDEQYKEHTIHNQICDSIRGSLDSISDPLSVSVTFQIGRLMSVVQPRSIFLPVQTEAILDYDFNKVKFLPNVSTKCLDSLYLNLFASKSNYFKLVPNLDYLEVEFIYKGKITTEGTKKSKEGFYHSKIYRIPFNVNETLDFNQLKTYIYNYLDSVIVYRPQSEYHYKVQTNCILSTDNLEESEISVSKILFRHLRTYYTSKVENVKFVKFNLEVIDQWDIPINDDLLKLPVNDMMMCFYESFISSNTSKVYTFLDFDNSLESKVKIIQLSTDSSKIQNNTQLYRQYKRQIQSKDNRFDYIISLLESNTRMLLDLFDSNADEVEQVDFYPNMIGDTAEFAQIHYDTRKVVKQQESAIEALRKYNNLVKRIIVLINVKQNSTVLDLACGHAQDLDKYNTKKIKKLMGIDISLREITEARRRYQQRKRAMSFAAEFHHGNLLESKIYSMYIKNQKFDVVSIQLAIHYILQNENSCNFILEKIHTSLNEGGLFIGSTICCDQLSRELVSNPPVNVNSQEDNGVSWSFGNPIFKITMDQKSLEAMNVDEKSQENQDYNHVNSMLNSIWGLKYHFYLMESIDESEYVVPWKAFIEISSKIGFRLVESLTFPEYLEKSKKLFEKRILQLPQNVYDNIEKHFNSISTFQFSKDQFRVFSLYKVFVFEKITRRDKLYIQGVKIKK